MFFSEAGRWAAVALLLLPAACSRSKTPVIERVAVLRFENLSSEASNDWMGRAASEVVADEISAGRNLYVIPSAALHRVDSLIGAHALNAPGVSAETAQARLSGATRLIYGTVSVTAGTVHLSASEEDVGTRKIVRAVTADGPDLLQAADKLARQLSGEVRAFSTKNLLALQAYATALDTQPADTLYLKAVETDPNFGAAYVNWIRAIPASGERILAMAAARGENLPAYDRAYLALETVNRRPDTQASIRALTTIAKFSPNDPGILRALGDAELSVKRYADAVREYRAALRTLPENVELWNSIGYAQMFAGDYASASQSVGEYRRLRPNEPNPLDSLGDVNYFFGNFGEAAKLYLEAQAKSQNGGDGSELIKAAYATAMAGDLAGANQVFGRYAQGRNPQDAGAAFRSAAWQYATGQRKQAMENLGRLADTSGIPQVKSAAESELALWNLEMGDRGAARAHAARAASIQASPFSALAQFLSGDPAPPGMQEAEARKWATGYALLFARKFTEAVPVWKEIASASGPSDQSSPMFYAWALIGSGRASEAAPLLERNPLPQPNSVADFSFLVYPRILFLRGMVAEKMGKAADANRDYSLFLKLIGPVDNAFGEKRLAEAALARRN